jgi:hypothetical protein
MRHCLLPTILAVTSACASVPRGSHMNEDPLRTRVTQTARDMVGRENLSLDGRTLPADCLSLPQAAYGQNGVELGAQTPAALYRKVRREGHWFAGGTPRRGDLVFLREADKARTLHVGLVGGVEPDGTIVVLQRMARGVTAYRMNPRHPHDQHSPGSSRSWNDTIASGAASGTTSGTASSGEAAPAGALFSGYASLLP